MSAEQAAFRAVAAEALRAALVALDAERDSEAQMQVGAAALALAAGGLVPADPEPEPEAPVLFRYQVRATRSGGVVQSVSISRRPRRPPARRTGKAPGERSERTPGAPLAPSRRLH